MKTIAPLMIAFISYVSFVSAGSGGGKIPINVGDSPPRVAGSDSMRNKNNQVDQGCKVLPGQTRAEVEKAIDQLSIKPEAKLENQDKFFKCGKSCCAKRASPRSGSPTSPRAKGNPGQSTTETFLVTDKRTNNVLVAVIRKSNNGRDIIACPPEPKSPRQ